MIEEPSAKRPFLACHPVLRDALYWSVPGLLFAAALRVLFLSYLPYAFWGADSRSYFSFAHELIAHHVVTLDQKRRYIYPLLMMPVALLPGPPLRWIALFQHALGVMSILPLGYLTRKCFIWWKAWIIPITVCYGGLPVILWYEHELLGDNLFFASLLWAFAGWVAWVGEIRIERSRRLFWFYFIPFAVFLLTKPSGRFAWPGVLLGLGLIQSWDRLDRRETLALVALFLASLTVGSKKQGAWLLYTATFPLTQLNSSPHQAYKAEIADWVTDLRRAPGLYYRRDSGPFEFLENPGRQSTRPLWRALGADEKLKAKVYMDLALEGIRAEPLLFVEFGLHRLLASANLSAFHSNRFSGANFQERIAHFYAEGEREPGNRVRMAFGLPSQGSIPTFSEMSAKLNPAPDSWSAHVLQEWVTFVGSHLNLVHLPTGSDQDRSIARARPSPLGVWLALALLLSFAKPYRRTFGPWILIAGSYLLGVFVVSQANPRYFSPAWVVCIPALALPADSLVRLFQLWFARKGLHGVCSLAASEPPATPPAHHFH